MGSPVREMFFLVYDPVVTHIATVMVWLTLNRLLNHSVKDFVNEELRLSNQNFEVPIVAEQVLTSPYYAP